ncbi:6669_t:CDS:1, partial [Gigaspora margarita]
KEVEHTPNMPIQPPAIISNNSNIETDICNTVSYPLPNNETPVTYTNNFPENYSTESNDFPFTLSFDAFYDSENDFSFPMPSDQWSPSQSS